MYVCEEMGGNERSGNDDKLMFSLGASLDGNIDHLLQCVLFVLLCFVFKNIFQGIMYVFKINLSNVLESYFN